MALKSLLDEQAYVQRSTPRTRRSSWPKRNTEHVERLISEGRMMEAGLVHVRAAKADGRWDKTYTVSEMTFPADFVAALENNPQAKQFFATLSKSNHYVIAHGLARAKKAETRNWRFEDYMAMLTREEKP